MEAVVEQDAWGRWLAAAQFQGRMYQAVGYTEQQALDSLTRKLPVGPADPSRRIYRYNYEAQTFERVED